MQPDEQRNQGGGLPQPHQPDAPQPAPGTTNQQAAAANVLRSQINSLYGDSPVATPAQTAAEEPSVYERTHAQHVDPQVNQWKEYHTAWQQYYQKYYEGYYAHQESAKNTPEEPKQGYFTHQTDLEATNESLSKEQALTELRTKLLANVKDRAGKIRKSRHFMPIVAALAVVLIFVFIQYNRVFIATVSAYVSPGAIDPQNIVIDPTAGDEVSPEPKLIIPKINVDVPVIYGIGPDHDSQMAAMEKGVAHFSIPGASSHPGEIGNTALSGHSSNDLFDPGDYKFIFAQLDKLTIGDTIYANYEGKRYTYVVTKTEVVKPTDDSALVYPTDKPVLTLITCTPLGTALNRLLVTAEQVSPDPADAEAAPADTETTEETSIPGSSPTLFERLFGA